MISLEIICTPITLLQYYRSYSLCCISTWIIYFKMGDWYLLFPFTYCTPLPSSNHPFVLSTIHNSQDMAIGDIGVHKYVPQ